MFLFSCKDFWKEHFVVKSKHIHNKRQTRRYFWKEHFVVKSKPVGDISLSDIDFWKEHFVVKSKQAHLSAISKSYF